jgi:hypothetical protein
LPFTDRVSLALFLCAFLCGAPALNAQTPDSQVAPLSGKPLVDFTEGVQFEITPHTGMMGGSGIFGLRLGANYGVLQIELAGEQVIGRTANMYPVTASAMLNLTTRGRLIPYGTVGVGLLLTVPTNTIGDRSVSTLGVSFGGGARYFVTPSFGFRAEVKQYMTSVSHSTEPGNKLLFFQELTMGVAFLIR